MTDCTELSLLLTTLRTHIERGETESAVESLDRLAEALARISPLVVTTDGWLQIEQAAAGCVSGTSDEWPVLRRAIENILLRPFGHRQSAEWLRGFCVAAVAMRRLQD